MKLGLREIASFSVFSLSALFAASCGEGASAAAFDAGSDADGDTDSDADGDADGDGDGDGDTDTDSDGDGDAGASVDGGTELPADPGSGGALDFEVTTAEIVVDDGGLTDTTVALTCYVPTGAGPYPVVLFNHGFSMTPDMYASYGEHLASWGYVACLPKMPGSVLSPVDHDVLAGYLALVLDWVEAEAEVVDGPLRGVADASRIGVSGHSLGGKISLLLCAEDERPTASFAVDPVDECGGFSSDCTSVAPELMPDIAIPLGLLGETTNAAGGIGGQACAPEDQNFQQYYAAAESPALLIDVLGANHVSFLDDPECGVLCSVCEDGTDDPAVTLMLTQRYLTAFYNVFLKNEEEYGAYLTGAGMNADVAAGLVQFETKNDF